MFVYWTLVQYRKKVDFGAEIRNWNPENERHALRLGARYIKDSSEVVRFCYANSTG